LPSSGKGPRSQFITAASDDLDKAGNGIWLCAHCAGIIDKNNGDDFPPFVLKAWKALHEAASALKQGVSSRRVGWIHRLELSDSVFAPGGTYEFGPANLFIGKSASGKSAILRLLSAQTAGDVQCFAAHGPFSYELAWFDPHLETVEVEVANTTAAVFRYAGRRYRVPPCPATSIGRESYGPANTVEEIADRTGIDETDVRALLPEIGGLTVDGTKVGPIERAWLNANDDVMYEDRAGQTFKLPMASGGEKAALILEIALSRAISHADGRPLAAFFDPFPTVLQQWLPDYVRALLERAGQIQVFATMTSEPKTFPLAGWYVHRL